MGSSTPSPPALRVVCAQALERATDIVLAHLALVEAYERAGDRDAVARHRDAIAHADTDSVATWARDRAAARTRAVE